MAGNSQHRGAVRRTGSKKGAQVGSGGQRRRGLEGKGPTPKAADRPNHKAYAGGKSATRPTARGGQRRSKASSEVVAGRNSVVEALRADVPDLRRFIRAIIQADAYGISVADVLRTTPAPAALPHPAARGPPGRGRRRRPEPAPC
mgnify:CR=1 FL=1